VVLFDRYIIRLCPGCGRAAWIGEWVRGRYKFAVPPAVAFYFSRSSGKRQSHAWTGLATVLSLRSRHGFALSDDQRKFRIFQGRHPSMQYEKMVPEFGLTVIGCDVARRKRNQAQVRQIVRTHLEDEKN